MSGEIIFALRQNYSIVSLSGEVGILRSVCFALRAEMLPLTETFCIGIRDSYYERITIRNTVSVAPVCCILSCSLQRTVLV